MPLQIETINILNNLIGALDVEIITIGNNPFRIKAKKGILISSIGNVFIYKFELDDTEDVPDDTNVEVLIGNQNTRATVISSHGLEIMLSFQSDRGESISQVIILISNSALLLSQKQLLEKIKNGEIRINENIVLKLFGLVEPSENLLRNYFIPPLKIDLDTYQTNTIEKVTNSDLSFIWGPPGTGKTIIISILTKIFLNCGLSVFITSNTNIAVDNAFDKFIELFQDTSADLINGKVIRYGNIQIEHIKEFVQDSAIIQRVAAPLYQQISTHNKELKPLNEKKVQLIELIKNFLEYQKINNQFQQQSNQLLTIKSEQTQFKNQLETTQNTLLSIEQNIIQLKHKFQISKDTNSFIRLLKGIKSPKSLEKEIKSHNYELNKSKIEHQKINNELQTKENELRQLEQNYEKTKKEIELIKTRVPNVSVVAISSIKSEIKNISQNIEAKEKNIAELNSQIEEIEINLINEAKVIGTTLSMFHSKAMLYSRKYDVVIIDEVTMAIQPQLFFASCFANKKVIVVGDFNQLQPIVHSTNPKKVNDNQKRQLAKEWLKKDIFRKNSIISRTDSRLNTLRIQRRMKAPIAEISNQTLYAGILEHRPIAPELNDEPAVSFYNTSNFKPYSTIPSRGQGRINVYNGVLSIKLAQKYCLLENINHIGIITPYRSQANLISKLIKDLNLQSDISADTVYKFQGLEKDIIIFDITDGINTRRFRLGANLRDRQESPYLFNVAFTRAKHKLIVIGDLDYLRKNRHDLPEKVRQMIGKITLANNSNYEIIDSMQIMDDLIYQNTREDLLQNFQPDGLKHFTEESFYQDFFVEVNNCKENLIIFSPFIANNRVSNNFDEDFFNDLFNKNIRIKIITKPIDEHPNNNRVFANNFVDMWRNRGITVEERKGMHEKIAILDKEIIYHGSLNILSQWRSQETMLKITGTNSVNELLKVYL